MSVKNPQLGTAETTRRSLDWNCCRDGTDVRATWINPDRMHIRFAGMAEMADACA